MGNLSLAIPVSGALYEGSIDLLNNCGLSISRSNNRVYTAKIPNLNSMSVMFQRQSDIPSRLDPNVADIGIVGLDSFYESKLDDGTSMVILDNLGFGEANLVLAVPEAWLDVRNLVDLADLSFKMREEGRDLRIATKYPKLVSRFLNNNSIYYFDIVDASGGIEVAPFIGYADMICDITASGNTLRQNRLKIIDNGIVFSSQAALIGNIESLSQKEDLDDIKIFIERIEGHINSKKYQRVTVNLSLTDLGLSSPDELEALISSNSVLHGLKGPSFSYVLTGEPGSWVSLELIISNDQIMQCVEELRKLGGVSITTSNLDMIFYKESISFYKLSEAVSMYGEKK